MEQEQSGPTATAPESTTPSAAAEAPGLAELMIGAPRSASEAIARAAIPIETLRELAVVRNGRSVFDLTLALAQFAALPILYRLFPHPYMIPALVLLAIRNFNCLAQLVHESDHSTLFRNRWLNLLLGNLCAYPLGYNRRGHIEAHMNHHLYLNTERDPDILWSPPDQTGRQMLLSIVADLFLLSALKRLLQYGQTDRATYTSSPWKKLSLRFFANMVAGMIPVVLVQGAIFALYYFTAGPYFYLWLHVLPIMMLYPMQIRIRSVAEHSFDMGFEPRGPEDSWVTRSSMLTVPERFIIGPYGQHLHYEHHIFPGIPNYNLTHVHRLMVEAGIPMPLNKSYVGFVLRKVWTDLRRRSRPADAPAAPGA